MQSSKLKLPSHVVARQKTKADGSTATYFYFTIARAEQDEWRTTRRLPLAESERTAKADAAELEAVFRDARALTERYERETMDRLAGPKIGTIPWLIARFDEETEQSRHAANLYGACASKLKAWSAANRHPHVERLTKPVIRDYLALLGDTPYMRNQVKNYLSRLMRIAIDYDLIDRNPVEGIVFRDKRREKTRASTGPWTPQELESRIKLAMDRGRPSIALALLIGHETGQRPENIDLFRRGEHYDPVQGVFAFEQTKTGAYVAVPATKRLRRWIEEFGGKDYLLVNEHTGAPYPPKRLQDHFRAMQKSAKVKVLKRRYLRHTCVCNLADAGCDVPQIASVTGHSLSGATEILSHYWRPSSTQAAAAIARREQYENAEQESKLSVETVSKPTVIDLADARAKGLKAKAKLAGDDDG